jgi:phosphoglycolate phosphatase
VDHVDNELSMNHASPRRRLVLFDIDGTLVDVRGAGRLAFAEALTLTWGVTDDLHDIRFAGATDLGVLRQLRQRHALPPEEESTFFQHMERTLTRALLAEPPHVYDGVRACLSSWASTDAMLGLLTGNALRTAHVKLETAGIDRSRFDVGGYGDEHHDRNELARLAQTRAVSGAGHDFDVIVVGDTPADIAAAKAIGATAVAVTTGHYDAAALAAAGADVVVDSLAHFMATSR